MAKRLRYASEESNRRKRAQGRGRGRLGAYAPWVRIQDVASASVVTRDKGWKTGRIHHLLSRLELKYFYMLDWADRVVDIREQFPLDQDETIAIAGRLGFDHPRDPKSKAYSVLTTSFVVSLGGTFGTREEARTVVYSGALRNRRFRIACEIERAYWRYRNIDWAIVTEQFIDEDFVANIEWVHPYRSANSVPPPAAGIGPQVERSILPELRAGRTPLREITNGCDDRHGLPPGSSLAVVRHLIANRALHVDMSVRIRPEKTLILL